jgi:hypothetical protein
MTARKVTGPLMALGLAVALGACGGGEPAGGPRPAESEVEAMRSRVAASPRTDAEARSAADEHFRRYNEMLGDCMGAAGFQFRPVSPPDGLRQSLGLTEEQFRRQYGFGISTLIEARLQRRGGKKDPNATYAAGLSPQAQRAYYDAYGDCQSKAFRELGPPPGMQLLSEGMTGVVERADQATASDPRVVRAKERFGDCLVRQGYRERTAEALTKEINDRTAPLRAAVEQALKLAGEKGGDPATVRAEKVLSGAQVTELEAIRRYELAAAGAVTTCERDGADVDAVQTEVRKEYVRRFLDKL